MHFTDLRIYQLSIKLAGEINVLIDKIPKRHFKDIEQLKKSSASVCANIAEGFGKRIYPKEFIRFLNIALGSSDETQNHILLLNKKGSLNEKDYQYFFKQYKDLSIKIFNLIKSIEKNNFKDR